jgi:8-oxo-dGTP pyrophosphatase MutT (NUDIX family)
VEAEWPAGRVRVSSYLGAARLPDEIPGRVRCLVSDGDSVLVTWDINGNADCLPGGGAEPGETVFETAYREVWEETAWHIDPARIEVLGWMHIETFATPDPNFPFPHPDAFMTVVHAVPVRAEDEQATWTDVDGYIARSAFVHVASLPDAIRSSPIHAPYLDAVFGDRWRTPQA